MNDLSSLQGLKFEKAEIYPGLLVIKENSSKGKVLGYVNKNPYEHFWFWMQGLKLSQPFHTSDEAIEDLIRTSVINSFDSKAAKKGVLYNENYVKGL